MITRLPGDMHDEEAWTGHSGKSTSEGEGMNSPALLPLSFDVAIKARKIWIRMSVRRTENKRVRYLLLLQSSLHLKGTARISLYQLSKML